MRVELTYLVRDANDLIVIPLREQKIIWSDHPLGNDVRELQGVRARVVPLALLRSGKASPRQESR